MSANTKVEWAHSTLNFWYGCTQLSPACDNCYAKAQVHRLNLGVVWNAPPVKAPRDRVAQLFRYASGIACKRFWDKHGERRRIFINSMSDFFDNQAPQEWRDEACEAFELCGGVDILLVTKRPQNVLRMVPAHWLKPGGWPCHVWLIVTAENETEARRRGAVIRGLREKGMMPMVIGASVEPMLESIHPNLLDWADWLIVGGESGGPKARNFEEEWARTLLRGARRRGQAFFFKQTRNKGEIPDN